MKKMGSRLTNLFFVGIDPGVHGHLTVMNSRGRVIAHIMVPYRNYKKKSGKGSYNRFCPWGLKRFLNQLFQPGDKVVATVELLGIQPRFGGRGNYGFGMAVWGPASCFVMANYRVQLMTAVKWQSIIGSGAADKGKSIKIAMKMFPELAADIEKAAKSNRDGIAESALICEAGRRLFRKKQKLLRSKRIASTKKNVLIVKVR